MYILCISLLYIKNMKMAKTYNSLQVNSFNLKGLLIYIIYRCVHKKHIYKKFRIHLFTQYFVKQKLIKKINSVSLL